MFSQFTQNYNNNNRDILAAGQKKDEPKAMAPTLRADIYSLIDQVKSWIVGAAGDGVSFGPIVGTIQKHFPETGMGIESMGQVENEVAVVVGGVTNMVLEMSRWDAMAAGMAVGGWVEALRVAHGKVGGGVGVGGGGVGGRKEAVGRGVMKGVNEKTDVGLMSKEFAARIQIISQLKTLGTKIWGKGSKEAREGEALWSSKFI